MRKIFIGLIAVLSISMLVSCATTSNTMALFEVGNDYTEYVAEGSSAWTKTYDVNVYVHTQSETLFNGVVHLTSDNMYVGEALAAAGLAKGFETQGALTGSVSSIGKYVNGLNNCYWLFKINGMDSYWKCNDVHCFPDDYVEWYFGNIY